MLKVATVSSHEPYREYKDVERVYSSSTEIDKILDKNGNVLFAVNKEVEGTPALAYKGKEETNLKNYRIYGNTVDGESVGDRTGNLFDEDTMVNGITDAYINSDGTIIYSQSWIVTPYIPCNSNVITLTFDISIGNYPSICLYDENKNYITGTAYRGSCTITVTTEYVAKYIRFSYTSYTDLSKIMLNSGSEPLPYEPYGYRVPVKVEGKNLLPNTATSQTKNGVTFTVNGDGSIFCNGQASPNNADLVNPDFLLPSGTYILTGCPDGGSDRETYKILIYVNGAWCANDRGSGANFTLTKTSTVSVRIAVYAGYTCDNLTFYPMIRRADITDDTYEPYHDPVITPIYLPEQIKMVGDEAEYIDYAEQKQHRVRKNLFYITKFTNNNTQSTTKGVNFSIIDNEVYANGTPTVMYPQASGLDYVLTEGETYAATLYIEGEYTGLPYIYCTTTYDSAGNYQKVPPNVRTIFTALPDTRILFVAQGTGESFNIKYKLLITKATIEDDTYEPYIENTEVDVTLPALPTLSGTNTLTVGTEVQPSNVYLKGRIKEIT